MQMNEIDIPDNDETTLSRLSPENIKQLEDKAMMFDKVQEAKTKDKAFTLIICLIVVICIIYGVDTVVNALNLKSSDLGGTLIDGFKLFISSLIGYVFAEKNRRNK